VRKRHASANAAEQHQANESKQFCFEQKNQKTFIIKALSCFHPSANE
jgi:hypothetical protein